MYPVVLATHNIIRWIVLIVAVLAVLRAYLGWLGGRAWLQSDRKVGLLFSTVLDVNFLLGLFLYLFLSPITRGAFQNLGAAMGNPAARFYLLEHIFYMVLALVLVHLGNARSKRATGDQAKHRTAALFYTLSVLIILIAIPWSQPLLPGL